MTSGEDFRDRLSRFAAHFEGALAGREKHLVVLQAHRRGNGGIEVSGRGFRGDDV